MATTRIKDISTTATSPNADDVCVIDGATAGTRKIDAGPLGGVFDETIKTGSGTFPVAALAGIQIANGASSYSYFSATDDTKQFAAGIDHTLSEGVVGMISNHGLRVVTNNTERLRVDANGNLGVGLSTVPSLHKLMVQPTDGVNFSVSNNGSALRLNAVNNDASANVALETTASSYNFIGGKVGIGGSPSSNLHVYSSTADNLRLERDATNDWRIQLTSGALAFRDATADAERLRITSSGELQVTGNGVIKNQESGGNYSYLQQTASDSRLFVQYSQPLLFGTAATERVRIDSSGRLGVNQSSPVGKLEVAVTPTTSATTVNETADFADSAIISNGGTSANGDRIPLVFNVGNSGANGISAAIVGERESSGWNTALSFWTNGVTSGAEGTDAIQEAMRLDGQGRLGIGAAPSELLHLTNATAGAGVDANIRFSPTTSTTRYAEIQAVNTDGNNNIDLRFFTAPAGTPVERLRIDSQGRVGIGGAPGSYAYSGADDLVVGDATGSRGITISSGSSDTGALYFGDAATTGLNSYRGMVRYSHSSDKLELGTLSQVRATIDSSGRLGVGSTTMGSYNSNANNLVVGTGSGSEGLTIATGSGAGEQAKIFFANGTAPTGSAQYQGYINFEPATNKMLFGTAGAEAFHIGSGGDIVMGSGNGIDFGSTSDGSGATGVAEIFDDYETGTVTVGVTTTTGSITLNTSFQYLYYTKIGRTVNFFGELVISSVSSPTGSIAITGLPFTSLNQSGSRQAMSIYTRGLASDLGSVVGFVEPNSTSLYLRESGTTSVGNAIAPSFQASTEIMVGGSYTAA